MTIEAAIHDKAIQFCGDAVEMCAAAGSGHPTTAMSISHLTAVLTHHEDNVAASRHSAARPLAHSRSSWMDGWLGWLAWLAGWLAVHHVS